LESEYIAGASTEFREQRSLLADEATSLPHQSSSVELDRMQRFMQRVSSMTPLFINDDGNPTPHLFFLPLDHRQNKSVLVNVLQSPRLQFVVPIIGLMDALEYKGMIQSSRRPFLVHLSGDVTNTKSIAKSFVLQSGDGTLTEQLAKILEVTGAAGLQTGRQQHCCRKS
jgi:hypothetical protein